HIRFAVGTRASWRNTVILSRATRDQSQDRLIVVSNRLPLVLNQLESGRWEASPSSGGLVSALVPVLQKRGGVWIGWPGTTDASNYQVQPALTQVSTDYGCTFRPVMLTR